MTSRVEMDRFFGKIVGCAADRQMITDDHTDHKCGSTDVLSNKLLHQGFRNLKGKISIKYISN